jgi:hypothetical protein
MSWGLSATVGTQLLPQKSRTFGHRSHVSSTRSSEDEDRDRGGGQEAAEKSR